MKALWSVLLVFASVLLVAHAVDPVTPINEATSTAPLYLPPIVDFVNTDTTAKYPASAYDHAPAVQVMKNPPQFEPNHFDPSAPSRLFKVPRCKRCKSFVKSLIDFARSNNSDAYALVIAAQVFCQQNDYDLVLRIGCTSFYAIEHWMLQGQLLQKDSARATATLNLNVDPAAFCDAADMCWDAKGSKVGSNQILKNPQRDVVVRFRFIIDLSSWPQSSPKLQVFIEEFLKAVAAVLDTTPDRLLLEISKDNRADLTVRPNASGKLPMQLALRFKSLVDNQDFMQPPKILARTIDFTHPAIIRYGRLLPPPARSH